jgi:hypothetical protein
LDFDRLLADYQENRIQNEEVGQKINQSIDESNEKLHIKSISFSFLVKKEIFSQLIERINKVNFPILNDFLYNFVFMDVKDESLFLANVRFRD